MHKSREGPQSVGIKGKLPPAEGFHHAHVGYEDTAEVCMTVSSNVCEAARLIRDQVLTISLSQMMTFEKDTGISKE